MKPSFDFHTHRLDAPAGRAIINVPTAWILHPAEASLRTDARYSVGIHPWLTADEALTQRLLEQLPLLLKRREVVAIGECGLDRLRGGSLALQEAVLEAQWAWANLLGLPMTLHVVKAFDRLLYLRRRLPMLTKHTIHGFRGNARLAEQLLAADYDLSFGKYFQQEAYDVTPAERKWRETDEGGDALH